jgi:UDP-N-acetylmuramoyl-L-alanyl-D-glutamate--2,6-diaminopimelate ligase
MGKAAAETAHMLVVTSDNPRSEEPEAIISQITSGMDGAKFIAEPDRRKAIFYALSNAAADDTVVICGKGHETTQEVKGVKYPFDDREVCREFC